MYRFKKIKNKILFFVIIFSVSIFTIIIGLISINSKRQILKDTKNFIDAKTESFANYVESKFSIDMGIARSVASSMKNYNDFDTISRNRFYQSIIYHVLKDNPNYIGVWFSSQLKYFNSSWGDNPGRVSYSYYRENGIDKFSIQYRDIGGIKSYTGYHKVMESKKETLMEPYFDIGNFNDKPVLMTTIAAPILNNNNEFVGLFGVDLELGKIQEFLSGIHVYNNSYPILISNNGILVSHPDTKLIGKSIEVVYNEETKQFDLLKKIKEKKSFSIESDKFGTTKQEVYISFVPIKIGNSESTWFLGLIVPVHEIVKEANYNFRIFLIEGLIGLFFLSLVIYFIADKISKPINIITKSLKIVAKGIINEKLYVSVKTHDEIMEMSNALNTSIKGLIDKVNFANNIGKGKLDQKMELLSNEDVLGISLHEMQQGLINASKEDEKRKIEDDKRNWATEGIAKFSEILRQNNNDIAALSFNVIKNLVEYTQSNQAGFFIVNDSENEHFLEMASCYAYDRRKFEQKKIYAGEGLVGACYQEKESIYITNIPDDYIHITSGLGDATPKSLLIVPLKLNDEIYGVIEIASFNAFEKHEIEFIEKVGESIASTISNVKINSKTAQLLEQSQHQAEMMKAQEEEMRQNMEELTVTQEESARKAEKMEQMVIEMKNQAALMQLKEEEARKKAMEAEGVTAALNAANMTIEYGADGKIININDNFLNFVHKKREDVIGTHHLDNINFDMSQGKTYEEFWNELINGKSQKLKTKVEIGDRVYWLMETYSPILDNNGKTIKILKIAIDITENVFKDEIIKQQVEELKSSEEELKQNIEELQTVQDQMQTREYLIKLLAEDLKIDEEKLRRLLNNNI